MTTTTQVRQGRAPGLYDEQLQRQQQEKSLFAGFRRETGRGLLGRAVSDRAIPAPAVSEGGEG